MGQRRRHPRPGQLRLQPPPEPRSAHRREHPGSLSRSRLDYYKRKLADAKTVKEALRALKRRISDSIYRQLLVDAQTREEEVTGPGGQAGRLCHPARLTDPQ
jgi:hypothetical protein